MKRWVNGILKHTQKGEVKICGYFMYMLTFINRRCLPNSLRNFLKVNYYELDPKVFSNLQLFGRRYQRQVKIWRHTFFAQPMKHANLHSFAEGMYNKLIIWFEWGKTHTLSLSLSLTHTHTHTHTHTTHTLNAHVAHVLGMLKTQWSKLSLQVTSGWLCVVLVFRDHPKSAQNGFHFLFFFSILVSNSIDLLGLPTKAKDIFRV